MKTTRILMMAAMATTMLASCSSEDELAQSNYPMDNMVRVTAGVDGMNTRAAYTTDNIDAFGISITSQNATYTYNNIEVTRDENNKWAPASMMLWQNKKADVDIVAVAPYKEMVADETFSNYSFSVGTDQSVENDRSDLLFYHNESFVPERDLNTSQAVDITFQHVLSQLNVNIELKDQFNQENLPTADFVSEVKINGTKAECAVNFISDSEGQAVASPTINAQGNATSVTPETGEFIAASTAKEHAKYNYSAILIPQTIAAGAFSVSFKVNGVDYVWTSTEEVTLAGNTKYQLNLTVGKDMVQTGSISADSWTEGEEKNLETE